jgi:CheY-like chemotaxis protein
MLVEKAIIEVNNYPLQPLRALILDYKMPQKNGIEVFDEVTQFYEHMRKVHSLNSELG